MAKQLISLRVSTHSKKLLEQIAKDRESTQANIFEEAIRALAKKEGTKIEEEKKEE